MSCPSCGAGNRPGARFCHACGAPQREQCARCSAELAANARFCDQCGAAREDALPERAPSASPASYTPPHLAQRILSRRSALEGERKRVTVMFVDIRSSLELSAGVDAEQWHGILDEFFRLLADGVHGYEGTINQYTGDGIMALFGAPIALEDHAARACRSALQLQRELRRYGEDLRRSQGLNVLVRTGLHSGEVVVGRIGDDLRMDYTAQGAVVGIAQRVEQIGEPGKVFLTEDTAALVEDLFDLRSLGDFSLRGVSRSVELFELLGTGPLDTRLEQSRRRGFSRLVGRDAEIERLEQLLARAQQGDGQVVGVVGDPGLGKSRLCHEIARRGEAGGMAVYRAHAVSHGRRIAFLPLLSLLRSFFDLDGGETESEARVAVAAELDRLNPELEHSLPLLLDFLGVANGAADSAAGLDPDLRRERIFRLLVRLLQAHARREPVLVLLEDLHWIDAATEAFLAHLIEGGPRMPLLLLLNYRPVYRPPWREAAGYRELPLDPLGPDTARELVTEWLGEHTSVRKTADDILERTAGNPFFIEEVVRSLVGRGALEGERGAYRATDRAKRLAVPDSVHGVLAERIDRLDERSKGLLQTASVLGERFSAALLERVAEPSDDALAAALATLSERQLLVELRPGPQRELGFHHPLTREVAYGSQLRERRRSLHQVVARVLVEQGDGGLDERSALLAHHFEAAGDNTEAARWHARAAHWVGRSNPAEALRHWRSAEALLRGRPDGRETGALLVEALTAILDLGWRFGLREDEARELFTRGRAIAREAAEPGGEARLLMGYGQLVSWTQATDGRRSLELGREAVALADQTDDRSLQAAARGQLARARWRARDYRASLRASEQALERAPDSNEHLRFRARVLSEMARLDEAAADLERALAIARQDRDLSERALTHLCCGIHARFVGDFALERRHAQTCLELAERMGDRFARTQGTLALAESYLWTGESEEACDLLEEALAEVRAQPGHLFAEASILGLLADAYGGSGRPQQALATAEEANALPGADSIQALQALARALMTRAERGDLERAAAVLDRADAFVAASGAASWSPHIARNRAALAQRRGDPGEARRQREQALHALDAMGASGHARELRALAP